MLAAPPDAVWRDLEDLATHSEWMADAVAIRFLTDQRSGVGTTFECDTKVGPIRLTDVMEITEWRPGKAMGVRHTGRSDERRAGKEWGSPRRSRWTSQHSQTNRQKT